MSKNKNLTYVGKARTPKPKKRKRNKKYGFANTRYYPHKNHPAFYQKFSNDDIAYLTFTHHKVVTINGKSFVTIPLDSKKNIDKNDKSPSYIYPKKFIGKRSSLGEENSAYRIPLESKQQIKELLNTLPEEKVKYSKK